MHNERRTSRTYRSAFYVGRRFFHIFCWGGLIFGIVGLAWNEIKTRRDRRSLDWPKVAGTIMQSELLSRTRSRPRYSSSTTYFASIAYTYRVNDARHLGHQVSLWNPTLAGDRQEALNFVGDHPVGSAVEVYYDPQQPNEAVLLRGADELGHRLLLWCSVCILAAAAFGLLRREKTRTHALPGE